MACPLHPRNDDKGGAVHIRTSIIVLTLATAAVAFAESDPTPLPTPNPTPGAERVEPLPTPREVKGSEHTGAGTSGGPAGYTGTGRGGTVGERGNDDNTEPSQLEATPQPK
jgi:hypothetical protein